MFFELKTGSSNQMKVLECVLYQTRIVLLSERKERKHEKYLRFCFFFSLLVVRDQACLELRVWTFFFFFLPAYKLPSGVELRAKLPKLLLLFSQLLLS